MLTEWIIQTKATKLRHPEKTCTYYHSGSLFEKKNNSVHNFYFSFPFPFEGDAFREFSKGLHTLVLNSPLNNVRLILCSQSSIMYCMSLYFQFFFSRLHDLYIQQKYCSLEHSHKQSINVTPLNLSQHLMVLSSQMWQSATFHYVLMWHTKQMIPILRKQAAV